MRLSIFNYFIYCLKQAAQIISHNPTFSPPLPSLYLIQLQSLILRPALQYYLFIVYMLSQSPSLLNKTNLSIKSEEPNPKLLITVLKEVTGLTVRPFKLVNELIALLSEQPFFKNFSSNFRLLSEMANKVNVLEFKEGEEIYHIRQLSNYFYLVLEGQVNLTVPQQIDNQQPQDSNNSDVGQNLILNNFLDLKQISQRNQSIVRIIKSVEKGQCFGEIMGEKSIRATNAVAGEDSTLLAMNKRTYQLLLKAQVKTQNRSKFLFLSSLPVLAPLHTFSLQSICLFMTEHQFTYGQVLFHEGDPIKKIYIIYSGQFKLMKALAKHAATSLQRKWKGQSEYKTVLFPKKQVPFIIVQSGEILGDGQIISNSQTYQHLCICQSQSAKVFSIDKRQYFKNITSQKDTYQSIRKLVDQKWSRRKSNTNNFISRRCRRSQMNVLLNSNEWAAIPKPFKIEQKSSLNVSANSLTAEDLISNEHFFINELNKTIEQNPNLNRFSVNKKKCQTETSSRSKLSPLIRQQKKDGVPHCVQDVVTLVKLKANFLRRFRKQKKKYKNVFNFNKQDVPLFIKSKYNRMEEVKP